MVNDGVAHRVRKGRRRAVEIRRELRRIVRVKRRIFRELHQMLRGRCQGPAKYGFVNQVDAEAHGVTRGRSRHVVAELILLLIARDGKRRDGGLKLVVTEGFEPRRRQEAGCERERQRDAQVRIAYLVVMKAAGLSGEGAKPLRCELKLVVQEKVVVIGGRRKASGGQRRLLHQVVLRVIAIQ